MDNLANYIGAAVALIGLIWAGFKIIAKVTPTKADDDIVAKLDPTVTATVDALDLKKQPK